MSITLNAVAGAIVLIVAGFSTVLWGVGLQRLLPNLVDYVRRAGARDDGLRWQERNPILRALLWLWVLTGVAIALMGVVQVLERL